MKTNRTLAVSIVLLLAGIYLSTKIAGLGVTEWTMLGGFVVLGLLSGSLQATFIVQARQGKITAGRRTLYVILSVIILIVVKGIVTGSVESNLEDTGISLYTQICFSLFGMFFSRSLMTAALDKSPARSIN